MSNPTLELIIAACPALASRLKADEDDGPYTVAGNVAHQLVAGMTAGDTEAFAGLFRAIEGQLIVASAADRDLIIVGLFEDLQNVSMNRGVTLDSWRPLLGPLTAEAWDVLAAMWSGKLSPDQFNAFVETGTPPTSTGNP